ncbi:MAG: S-layer homology domain-containing protein, partial [Clostridiales bacterium]|nr:S-layer homology domain-containing protein [Clostridiales bacterium]
MKKDFKRILAVIISVIMLLQPVAFAASVLDFPDFPTNDWSTEAMTAAVENGLYIGDENNLIKPDAYLTRAEFSAFVVRAFGATVKADISRYTDVKESDWFHDDIAKANNMGALNGTSETTFSPENKITRQEVFVAIARILCVTSGNIAVIDKFSDSSDVASWAQANIAGLVEYGYINGYPDGTIKPLEYITRAEIAQLFHNMFKTYIGTAGYHSEVAPVGSVIIRGPGVHLENVTINGDLIIADGVGAGDFNLTSVTVLGRIVARGGEGIVTFKSVSVRDGVFIFDNNGTVNFNNYRTDPPFVKLTEYTPATFLKDKEPEPSSGRITGGGGGGNYKYYNVNFYKD